MKCKPVEKPRYHSESEKEKHSPEKLTLKEEEKTVIESIDEPEGKLFEKSVGEDPTAERS